MTNQIKKAEQILVKTVSKPKGSAEKQGESETTGKSRQPFDSTRLEIFPFHHLISAPLLVPVAEPHAEQREAHRLGQSHSTREQLFWQSLAARGISAKEAALFDDSIECSFLEPDGSHLIQVDWEALHYDALAGCAEFYLAEMFTCKQRIFEAVDKLPDSFEFSTNDLLPYFSEEIFKPPFAEKFVDLFLDGLSASFILTVSHTGDKPDKSSGRGKPPPPPLFPDIFQSHLTRGSKRINEWSGTQSPANGNQTDSYTVNLANYWRGWQKAAILAKFDFDFLKTLTDARAVRFYEMTKLRRAHPIYSTGDKLPGKLEMEYEKFVSLMPLPRLTSEREVKRQIDDLIRPLKQNGYIKSFTLKPDWRNNSIRSTRLIFRFNN